MCHTELRADLCQYTRHTQKEGGLAHGLEAAAAVLINCSVTSSQDDQHPIVGELLASRHWSLQETAAPRRNHLKFTLNNNLIQ